MCLQKKRKREDDSPAQCSDGLSSERQVCSQSEKCKAPEGRGVNSQGRKPLGSMSPVMAEALEGRQRRCRPSGARNRMVLSSRG